MAQRYSLWEIGHPLSAARDNSVYNESPAVDGGEVAVQEGESLIKVRGSRGTLKPGYTYFEGLMTLEKFNRMESQMLSLIDCLD